MRAALFIIFWLLAVVAVAALLIAHMLRTVDERKKSGSHRIDSEAHRRSAENAAEVESHDIDDMLDAINERRRRARTEGDRRGTRRRANAQHMGRSRLTGTGWWPDVQPSRWRG